MKRLFLIFSLALGVFGSSLLFAADAPPAQAGATNTAKAAEAEKQKTTTAAAAATATGATREVHAPDFLEQTVDLTLDAFDIPASGNTTMHFVIAAFFLAAGLIMRRVVTAFLFRQLRRVASHTTTTLDDKLFNAFEPPVGAFVMLLGIFAAFKVLKLPEAFDRGLAYGSTVAFTLVIFWGLLRALGAVLDHAQEMAVRRQLSVAAFMPWIKKTLATIFVAFGVLMIIQSFGYDVKAILAGLGLGGLAFALAAQDTLANVFGSVVVAIDQPFKVGEFVQIGPHAGAVEDIGLRSTKLRRADKSLIVIPNKTVAAEAVTNLARFIRRRSEQVITLTYATKPEEMEAIVEEFKGIITAEKEVDPSSVMVFFRDLSASSLDIWVVYETFDPDFQKSMHLKQRINLAMMRAVYARGLAFAFPTQTIELAGPAVEKLVENRESGEGEKTL